MADTSNRTGGVLSFVAGGIPLELEASIEIMPSSFQRTSVGGLLGPAGTKREYAQPRLEATCFYKADVSIEELQGLEGITVQVNLDNGHAFVLTGASQVEEIKVDLAAGTFPIIFDALECKEV